jgi:hypothetical protein
MTFVEDVEHLGYCLSTMMQLLHQGQTEDQHFYTEVLQHLWKDVLQKWPEKCHMVIDFSTAKMLLLTVFVYT